MRTSATPKVFNEETRALTHEQTHEQKPTNKSTNKPTRETVGRAAYTSTFPGVCLHVDVSDRDYARRFRCWLSASRKTLRGHGKFGRCLKQICWPFPRVLRGNRRDGLGVLLSLSLTALPRRTRVIHHTKKALAWCRVRGHGVALGLFGGLFSRAVADTSRVDGQSCAC